MKIHELSSKHDRRSVVRLQESKIAANLKKNQHATDSIDELMKIIEAADGTYPGKQQNSLGKIEIVPDTEVLYNGPDGQLAVPKTQEAGLALSAGTMWGLANPPGNPDKPNTFNFNNRSGKTYIWRGSDGDKSLFHWGDSIDFVDSTNKLLSAERMHFFRSVQPATKKLFAKYESSFINSNNYNRMLHLSGSLKRSGVKLSTLEYVMNIEENAKKAFKLASRGQVNNLPELESTIAKSANYSFQYAKDVVGGQFPAGEPAIAKSVVHSFLYATKAIKRPFPAGEPVIANNLEYSYKYALAFNKRFPAGEPIISTSDQYSYMYTKDVLNRERFPAGEPIISKDAVYSYEYALLIKRPFPAGEAAIATSPHISFLYATKAIKRPFPAGEAAIATIPRYAKPYDKMFGTNLAQQ